MRWIVLMAIVAWISIEVWIFHLVSTPLGVGWTLFWVFTTGALGLVLLRLEGIRVLFRIYDRLRQEELPTSELIDMGMVLVGAFLLVLPGFFTDIVGGLLLLPPVRWFLRGFILRLFDNKNGQSQDIIDVTPED